MPGLGRFRLYVVLMIWKNGQLGGFQGGQNRLQFCREPVEPFRNAARVHPFPDGRFQCARRLGERQGTDVSGDRPCCMGLPLGGLSVAGRKCLRYALNG